MVMHDLTTCSRSCSSLVTYVSHDFEDGAWQFLGDSMASVSGAVLRCFHQVVEADPSLIELVDLRV